MPQPKDAGWDTRSRIYLEVSIEAFLQIVTRHDHDVGGWQRVGS
jgi:hypothetical protein